MTTQEILDRLSDVIDAVYRMPNNDKVLEDLDNLWADIDNSRYNVGIANW